MQLPKGMTEEYVLSVMKNVAGRLAEKFKFGYNELEDMRQEAYIFAIEALDKYDESRPLENYLYACVHNRLFNLKRNKYKRPDIPCFLCPLYDSTYQDSTNQCIGFIDKMECEKYNGWLIRNECKANLMHPIELDETNTMRGYNSDNAALRLDERRILQLIDQHIPIIYREDYIKFKTGTKLSKNKRLRIIDILKTIIAEHYGKSN